MAFLAPFTLLGLLLVSLPLLIHLLVRRRGQRLDFPSLRFLREMPSFKLYPRRIRQPLLLVLRAAAIILLVMGLARPFLISRVQMPEAVRFIMIDASLSMKTNGRVEAAREQARAIIKKLAKGERAGVITLSSEAITLVELTGDRERLLEAVERCAPMGGALDYHAGFAEIRRQLQNEPQVTTQIDIISDFQASNLEERDEVIAREAGQFRVSTYGVGAEVERNAFLTGEVIVRSERGLEVSASEIVSERDGRSGARRAWMIEGSEGARDGIEWRTEANNQITGRLKVFEPDEFDADDERFFAFAPPREQRVLLIEDEAGATPYLNAALEAGAGKDGKETFALERRRRLPGNASDLAAYALVVATLHGAVDETEARTLIEYARAGGTVWMFTARDLDSASWSRFAGRDAGQSLPFESIVRQQSSNQPLTFGAMDADAPQIRNLDESALAALVGAVRVRESYALTPRASADTLMRWSDGTPAFISASAGEGTMMVLATSPERESSDLGLSPSFPALVASVSQAAAKSPEPLSQVIGEAVRLNVPLETDVKIANAQGGVSAAKARELVRRPLAYFSEPGIYKLEFAGQRKFMAFNAPVVESERALISTDEFKRRLVINDEAQGTRAINVAPSREAMERSGSMWRYFLVAAFLLLVAELFMAMSQSETTEVVNE